MAQSNHQLYKTGELLVKYRPHTGYAAKQAVQNEAGALTAQAIGRSKIHRIVLEPGTTVEHALDVYAANPNVEIAEPNYLLQAQSIPDDTSFAKQWGLYNTGQIVSGYAGTPGVDLNAPEAWDITAGSTEVIVAVVDTGCDLDHPDLAGNIWTNSGEIAGDGIDNDGNGYIDDVNGWDFADGDNDPHDASGHGTHVAGIIGAVGNNNRGIAGVAWQTKIMPLRFLNAFDSGTTADAIFAIQYALNNGAKIINCSWGGAGYSTNLRNVIASANALFVCAAGNNASDTDIAPYYPASYDSDNIISVAASDQQDQMTWFSNYGTVTVDVAAPGIRIYSLNDGRRTLWSDNFTDGVLDGWTTGGTGNAWDIEDPPGASGAPALASSPDTNYTNHADTWAKLPTQDLSSASATQLTFSLVGSSEANADYLYLEISTDGSNWASVPLKLGNSILYAGISGNVPYWMTVTADLGLWDGRAQVYSRLRFDSDASTTGAGFYIDSMRLTAADATNSYQYMQGTSMAAGYVSGTAALIQSEDASLSPVQIKSIVEYSVDLSQNLLDKVASGGRVNAYYALKLLRELSLSASTNSSGGIRLSWTTEVPLTSQTDIQRRQDGQMDFTTIAQVNANTTLYNDDSASSDVTYYYRVASQILNGDSGYSHQAVANATGSTGSSVGGSSGGGGGGGGCFIGSLTIR